MSDKKETAADLKVNQIQDHILDLDPNNIKIFSGNANPKLARDVAALLGQPLGEMIITRFSDGELRCAINESIRGADVFIIQPTCAPVNDTLMELLILCDAFKRASPPSVSCPSCPILVMPGRTKRCARANPSLPNWWPI